MNWKKIDDVDFSQPNNIILYIPECNSYKFGFISARYKVVRMYDGTDVFKYQDINDIEYNKPSHYCIITPPMEE